MNKNNFKVGDRIRISSNNWDMRQLNGISGIIIEIKYDKPYPYEVALYDGDKGVFDEEEIVLVNKYYHPRLIHKSNTHGKGI